MKRLCALTTCLVLLGVTVTVAQDDPLPEGFETQSLIKSSVSRVGDPIVYPTGTPEVVSVIGTLAKDGRTASTNIRCQSTCMSWRARWS